MTNTSRPIVHTLAVAAFMASSFFTTGSSAQPQHAGPPRDQWQRVPDVIAALGVVSGSHVADIGAGSGFFTTRLATAVGDSGRVYAVDVNPISLRELKETLGSSVTNVEIVRGDENDPHLPPGRLDAALIVNAYHEFAEYREMLQRIKAALKPGGRLVLIEPIPRGALETTRALQTKNHTIAIELAEADLVDAGFEIVLRDAAFVTRPEHQGETKAASAAAPTDWMLVARRRSDSPLF